jgi:hypothetical protein
MNTIKKSMLVATIALFTLSSTGCVTVNRYKQSGAAEACRIHGGTVKYNLVSTTCVLPSGRSFTTY